MSHWRRLALSLVLLVVAGGCDARQILLETELAPAVREQLATECCACLAAGEALLTADACAGEPATLPDEGAADAGPLTRNPCVCSLDAAACSQQLIAGVTIEVIGACTAEGGACEQTCRGVLAYP